MRKGRCPLLIVAVAFGWMIASTAVCSQTTFSVEQLRHDFQQLRTAMEENPSILYQFTDKETYDRFFDEQYGRLTRSMTTEEFRLIIAPLIAKAGCLHTSLWMPQGYWHNADAKLIPLRPVFLGDTCYVWVSSPEAGEIHAGSEVLAIDGTPISEILDVVKANVSADGFNDSYRRFKMNEGFVYRFALDFGFHDTFTFTFRLPGGTEPRTLVAKSVGLATAEEHSLGKNSTEGNALDFTRRFEVLPDSATAIITARSFAFYDRPETFTDFVDSAFAYIDSHGIRNLILDVRNNDGGNPFCSVRLFSYLEPRPLPYFAEEYGRYAELARPIPRAEKPFTGNLYTLINGDNVSTTPHFLALLKYHRIGTLVGTETGGTYACNAATRDLVLENTKFIVTLSTKSFAAAVDGFPRTRGIIPDVTVRSTIDDVLHRRDAQKEYVLRLIGRTE